MSENTKIKLNLKWLEQTDVSSKKVPESSVKSHDRIIFKFTTKEDLHPPIASEKYKINVWNDNNRNLSKKKRNTMNLWVENESGNDNQKESWKMSFSKIAWKKDDQVATTKDTSEEVNLKDSETQNKENAEQKEEKIEEEVQFTNYKSKFKDESENIIKRIRNFKYSPKTRTGFVFSLILITALWIWSMMILFPERHSLEIYRTSLIDLYQWDKKQAIGDSYTFHEDRIQQDELHSDNEELIDSDNNKNKSDDVIHKIDIDDINKVEDEMHLIRNFLQERYR